MNVNVPSAALGLTMVGLAMLVAGSDSVRFFIVPLGALAAAVAVGVGFLPRKAKMTFDDYSNATAIYAVALSVMILLYAVGAIAAARANG